MTFLIWMIDSEGVYMEDAVKDYRGKILGWVETDIRGNKIYKDFYRRIVARYDKRLNVTKDFSGRLISKGDTVISKIMNK